MICCIVHTCVSSSLQNGSACDHSGVLLAQMFSCIGHIWKGSLHCCGSSHGSQRFCCLSLDTSHQNLPSQRTNLVQRQRQSKQLQLNHNLQISESTNNICSLYHVISFKRKVKLCFIFPASTSSIYKSRSHPTIYVVYIIPTNHIITITIHHPWCDTIWQNYS